MTDAPSTICVVIPLKLKRRNGRPRILPPDDLDYAETATAQDPHLVRAIARAWNWRRKLENSEIMTIADLAAAENVSDRFVNRTLRLVYRRSYWRNFSSTAAPARSRSRTSLRSLACPGLNRRRLYSASDRCTTSLHNPHVGFNILFPGEMKRANGSAAQIWQHHGNARYFLTEPK